MLEPRPEEAATVSDPQRTPHPEEPAEGTDTGTDAGEADTSGRTPHPEEPAEGGDPTSGSGADTPG
jgi:hypothetical protein